MPQRRNEAAPGCLFEGSSHLPRANLWIISIEGFQGIEFILCQARKTRAAQVMTELLSELGKGESVMFHRRLVVDSILPRLFVGLHVILE